ncbi:transmembrane protein 63C [Platysternon megacephalum]|uniref:Transmembrane protein 63C n=1 Tax=Platysternon megacephalum TaxID=55544 RepID=A0A4D9F0R5_9SAUR|nr:transmembrane protein 63C [Platysternon megacephalum]
MFSLQSHTGFQKCDDTSRYGGLSISDSDRTRTVEIIWMVVNENTFSHVSWKGNVSNIPVCLHFLKNPGLTTYFLKSSATKASDASSEKLFNTVTNKGKTAIPTISIYIFLRAFLFMAISI